MKTKFKVTNTLGMFDLLKGIAMLLIVLAHNRSLFPDLLLNRVTAQETSGYFKYLSFVKDLSIIASIIFAILAVFFVSLMPALLIISGYGFRKRNIGKFWSHSAKELIKPYVITAIVTTILHMVLHYTFFHYLRGAIKASAEVFGGQILGLSQTTTFAGITLYANGPIWYLLTLFWAISFFNVIVNKFDEKSMPYAVFSISVIGWLLSYLKFVPFCISQGMVGVIYIYIGYILKKTKFFQKTHTTKWKVLYFCFVVIPNIVLLAFGYLTEMADNVYSLGPITYIENGLLAIGFLACFLRFNAYRGKITNTIRMIGRYSLYVMCVHSVEMIAIPWYKIAEQFENSKLVGFIIIYIIRLIIIFVGCFATIKILERIKKNKQIKK